MVLREAVSGRGAFSMQREAIRPEQRIRAEQVRLLYEQVPVAIAATLLVAAVVAYVLWDVVPRWALGAWLAAVAASNLVRGLLAWAWHRAAPPPGDAARWERRYVLAVALVAATWGLATPWFASRTDLYHHVLLAFVQGGMAAGAVSTMASSLRAYLVYMPVMVVPLGVQLALQGEGGDRAMALLLAVFALLLVSTARRINATVARQVRLALENEALARRLAEEKARALAGQRGLEAALAERRRAEDALLAEKERMQVTLASIGDAVLTTDTEGRVDFLNRAAEALTGWTAREAVGRRLDEVLELVDEAGGGPIALPAEGGSEGMRALLRPRGGGPAHSVELTLSPIRHHDGRVLGSVAVLHDVTALRDMARRMAHQAAHDPLTGLLNRREFERLLEHALVEARERGAAHVLLYMDLDQFKVVNDSCGHLAGDELLRQVASLFQGCLRAGDALARLGGDEFAVLLAGCGEADAQRVAEKLRRAVADFRFSWEGRSFGVGLSIGLVPVTATSGSLTDLLAAADAACYAAKAAGRNRVHVHRDSDGVAARRRGELRWVEELERAAGEGRLLLHGQWAAPLLDGAGMPPYLELLVRLVTGDGRIVEPGAFLPAAQRYRVMPAVDRWVLDQALGLLPELPEGTVLGLNVSAVSLADEAYGRETLARLREAGPLAGSLCFEVSENDAVSAFAAVRRFTEEAGALGCRFALDDFGAGLSSFAYVRNLPVRYLKIHGELVRDLLEDRVDEALVEAVNLMAHVLERLTIAEWAETAEVVARLRELGVDYAQGHAVAASEPVRLCLQAGPPPAPAQRA